VWELWDHLRDEIIRLVMCENAETKSYAVVCKLYRSSIIDWATEVDVKPSTTVFRSVEIYLLSTQTAVGAVTKQRSLHEAKRCPMQIRLDKLAFLAFVMEEPPLPSSK
jgi:hypothetical protein